jgi:hypothetical protein
LFAFYGRAQEDFVGNRAWRLLDAAARGGPVKPLAEEERDRLEQIRGLLESTVDDGFELLAELQPELQNVADRISSATDADPVKDFGPLLKWLVGASADTGSVVLRSHCAEVVATRHLRRLVRHETDPEVLTSDDYGWCP